MTKDEEVLEQAAALVDGDSEDGKNKIIIMPPMAGLFGPPARQPGARIVKLFGEVCDEQSERIIEESVALAATAEELFLRSRRSRVQGNRKNH